MPFYINNQTIGNQNDFDDAISGVTDAYRNCPEPSLTNVVDDHFVQDRAVTVCEHEYAYIDLRDDRDKQYFQVTQIYNGFALYFSNEYERMLIAISGSFDHNLESLLSYFKDKSQLNATIVGGGTYRRQSESYPDGQNLDSLSIAQRCLQSLFDLASRNQNMHINLTQIKILAKNAVNDNTIAEVMTHYLQHKLSEYSQAITNKPLQKKLSLTQPDSNFIASLTSNAEYLPAMVEYITRPFNKNYCKQFLEFFPGSRDNIMEIMAESLFTQEALAYLKDKMKMMDLAHLANFAINLGTHKLMINDVRYKEIPEGILRESRRFFSSQPLPLLIYHSENEKHQVSITFDEKFLDTCNKWMPKLNDLKDIQEFAFTNGLVQALIPILIPKSVSNLRLMSHFMRESERITNYANKTFLLKLLREDVTSKHVAKYVNFNVISDLRVLDIMISVLDAYKHNNHLLRVHSSLSAATSASSMFSSPTLFDKVKFKKQLRTLFLLEDDQAKFYAKAPGMCDIKFKDNQNHKLNEIADTLKQNNIPFSRGKICINKEKNEYVKTIRLNGKKIKLDNLLKRQHQRSNRRFDRSY